MKEWSVRGLPAFFYGVIVPAVVLNVSMAGLTFVTTLIWGPEDPTIFGFSPPPILKYLLPVITTFMFLFLQSMAANIPYAFFSFVNFLGAIIIVPTNERAIFLVFAERRREYFLTEGLNYVPPFRTVMRYDARQHTVDLEPIEALSKDNVVVKCQISFLTRIEDFFSFLNINEPHLATQKLVEQNARETISRYDALQIAGLKTEISKEILENAKNHARPLGIAIEAVYTQSIRLPEELERFVRVVELIKQAHPEIQVQNIINAIQTDRANIRKTIIESPSLEVAAMAVVGKLLGRSDA